MYAHVNNWIKKILKQKREGSKMVTGTQLHTSWAPWSRDFTEKLETHLTEYCYPANTKLHIVQR
jgi:hypothetical protein